MDIESCPRCGRPVHWSGRGRRARWCSPACRRAAYEERRAAATGAIAVRVVQRETTREPSPAECVARVLASPRACREVLNGLTTLAANGQLDTGAHTATPHRPGTTRAYPHRRRHLVTSDAAARAAEVRARVSPTSPPPLPVCLSVWGTPSMDTRTRTRTASNQDSFHPVLTVVYRSLRVGLDGTEARPGRQGAAMDNTTTTGQRVGYVRVSSLGQCTDRQLDGMPLDQTFTDRCSGRDTNRPALNALLNHVRAGDTMVCHSLDRLARNLTDLRALVTDLTDRGVRVEFVKENLAFTGGDSPLQTLLLSMLGSVAEFERALIHERQLEGVALAKAAGRYKGGTPKLSSQRAAQLRERVAAGQPKAALAREFGITRQTLYNYLAAAQPVPA